MCETVTNVGKNDQANGGACNSIKLGQNISNDIKKAIADSINSKTITVNL